MTLVGRTRHYLCSHGLVIVAAIALGVAVAGLVRPFQASPAQSDDPAAAAAALQKAFINVVDNVRPAVVKISAEQRIVRRRTWDDFFDLLPPWSLPERREERRTTLGSGVIIDKEGYILTAGHVVEDVETEAEATSVEVTLTNGEEYEGKILGTDRPSDLAVIKIDPREPLVAAPLGDGGTVKVGEWVLAMGNPLGYEASVTAGIVSATGRGFRHDVEGARRNMIQTDAAINRGNSGGPLVNIRGEVIGINRAIATPSRIETGNVGLGFATAIDAFTREVINTLKQGEQVHRGRLGVVLQDLTSTLRRAFGVERGAFVTQVLPDSPAAKAGVKPDDVIVEFSGAPVTTVDDLVTTVQRTKPGTEAKVVVLRDGKRETLSVKVGGLGTAGKEPGEEPGDEDLLGMTVAVRDIDPDDARQYGRVTDQAVVVTRVDRDRLAARTGIRAGDVVLSLNRRVVHNLADYQRGLAAIRRDGYAVIRIGRRGVVFVFQIPEVE